MKQFGNPLIPNQRISLLKEGDPQIMEENKIFERRVLTLKPKGTRFGIFLTGPPLSLACPLWNTSLQHSKEERLVWPFLDDERLPGEACLGLGRPRTASETRVEETKALETRGKKKTKKKSASKNSIDMCPVLCQDVLEIRIVYRWSHRDAGQTSKHHTKRRIYMETVMCKGVQAKCMKPKRQNLQRPSMFPLYCPRRHSHFQF